MWSFSVVIFVLGLATGLTATVGNGTDNKVRDLMDAYLTYLKAASAKTGPIRLEDVNKFPITSVSPPVSVLLSTVNLTWSGLSDNTISNVSVVNNTAQYTMTFPDIKVQSDYQVSGQAYGRPTVGQGHGTIDLAMSIDVNVTFRNVDVQFPLSNKSYLQIAELYERFNLQGLATNMTGLTVLGLSEAEATKLLDAQITAGLTQNFPLWSKLESEWTKVQMNAVLTGSSIDDAINWLKTSKPDPAMLRIFIPSLI